MSGFVVIAGLLTLAALAALLFPLLRRREGSPEAWRSAGIAGLLILVGAAALYPLWSTYEWHQPQPAADTPEAMVGRLARRLEREPGDLDGWLMLGDSYSVLQQYELSARAYQRADTLAGGRNPEALIGLAEALLQSGRSDLAGRAGRLFEQALTLEGARISALAGAALAAEARNELPLAKQRFEALLNSNPPPPEVMAESIRQRLRMLDAMMQMTANAPGSAGTAATGSEGAAAAASVPLRITLAPSMAGKAQPGSRMFVSARIPGQPGPPVAASLPLEVKFPQDVDLRSTDTPMGGAGFTAGQELQVEARISIGGGAGSQSGDPFGVIRIRAGGTERAAIEINQLKP